MADKVSGGLKGFYSILGATLVVAAGTLGWSVLGGRSDTAATQPIDSIVYGDLEDLEALVALASGVERGDPAAPITILEFGDFQCPACREFATLVKPQVDLAFVDEGVARFVFHDWPVVDVHPHAFLAARAARCVLDQGDRYFWPFHDQLFAQQPTWSVSRTPPIGAFESYAGAVGLDTGEFSECLESDRHADVVSANMRLGIELGVDRTPTIFVARGGAMGIRVQRWNEFDGVRSAVERLMNPPETATN